MQKKKENPITSFFYSLIYRMVRLIDGEVLPWRLVYIFYLSLVSLQRSNCVHEPSELSESVSPTIAGY